MYFASLIVVVSVGLIVMLWAGFMVWGFRSGQFKGMDRVRRLPLDDDAPQERQRERE